MRICTIAGKEAHKGNVCCGLALGGREGRTADSPAIQNRHLPGAGPGGEPKEKFALVCDSGRQFAMTTRHGLITADHGPGLALIDREQK